MWLICAVVLVFSLLGSRGPGKRRFIGGLVEIVRISPRRAGFGAWIVGGWFPLRTRRERPDLHQQERPSRPRWERLFPGPLERQTPGRAERLEKRISSLGGISWVAG